MTGTPGPQESFNGRELLRIFSDTFQTNPRVLNNARTYKKGEGWEPTPVEDALLSSPLLDYVRQHLPYQVRDTPLARKLPGGLPEWAQNLRLGGYGPELKQQGADIREENPIVRARTYARGQYLGPDGQDVPLGDGNRRRLAQAAGLAAGDLVGQQGLAHLWWFLNAAPAVTSIAQLQAIHNAGTQYRVRTDGSKIEIPLLKERPMRMAATAPAWIAINFATGAFGRQPGYGASVPSEQDRTVAVNPVLEAGSRLFLNRSGKLLPYDEFVKERPDVSKGEYEAYKAYLYGNPSPIKGTLDGIHGPEINFLGKSIPLLTGILPAVAGILGARYGATKAAKILHGGGKGPNRLEAREEAYKEMRKLNQDADAALEARQADLQRPASKSGGGARPLEELTTEELVARMDNPANATIAPTPEELQAAANKYRAANDIVQRETLKQVLTHSSGALAGSGLLGAALESFRQSLRGRAPEDDEIAPIAPVAPAVSPAPRPL